MVKLNSGQNERGPIAATYSELQRLPAIRRALHCASALPEDARTACAYAQAIELLLANMGHLVKQGASELDATAIQPVVEKWIWLEALANLAMDFVPRFQSALSGSSIAGPLSLLEAGSKGAETFALAKLDFDELAERIFWRSQNVALRKSHIAGHNYEKLTVFLQTAKNVNHDTLTLISTPCVAALDDYDDLIGGANLREAGDQDGFRMADTFFLQFLVLHQVPEILGHRASMMMQDAAKNIEAGNLTAALSSFGEIIDLVDAVILSLQPLKRLMIPVDYYKIRENLGLTSGSHSETIHDELLNKSFRVLKDAAAGIAAAGALTDLVASNVDRLAHRLVHWRTQHLTFPRNLLGGHGTRSLVGAYGLAAAEKMLETFEKSLGGPRSSSTPTRNRTEKLVASLRTLDDNLLGITASIVQSRFPNVQNRTPPFDGRVTRSGSSEEKE